MFPPIARRTLANGLRCTGIQRPGSTVSFLCVDVRVGSRFERPEESGLSHLLEHMVFQGCEGYADGDAVNRAAERLGGQVDAYTDRDHTWFEQRVDPAHLDEATALMAGVLGTPAFRALENERAIVLEEALDEFDETGERTDADTLSRGDLWPDSPLGQPLIGTEENLRRFQVEDLRRFHGTHYGARNMLACAVGPQPPAELLDLLERHLAPLPAGERFEPEAPRPLRKAPHVRFVDSGRSQVEVRLVFRTPSALAPEATAISMLRAALDSGLAARMYRRLGGELGLAYEQWAAWEAYHDTGAFELGAHVSPQKVLALVDECYALLRGLADDPPDGEELDRLRFRAGWGVRSALDTPEGLVHLYATPHLYDDAAPEPGALLARIEALTPADLARVAADVFRPEHHVACFVGPLSKADRRGLRRAVGAFTAPGARPAARPPRR